MSSKAVYLEKKRTGQMASLGWVDGDLKCFEVTFCKGGL